MTAPDRYSNTDKLRIQREFAEQVTRFRKVTPIAIGISLAVIAIGFILYAILPSHYQVTLGIAGAVFVVASLFIAPRFLPTIKCPGCRASIERAWGAYCPMCSAHGLRTVKPHWRAECDSCKRELVYAGRMGNGRRRTYKISACTSCGVQFGGRSA